MRICLLRPTYGSRFQVNAPLSLGYLASALRSQGYQELFLLDGSLDVLSPAAAVERLESQGLPDLIGIQVYTGSHRWTRAFMALMQARHPQVEILLGGPHITALKGLALEFLGGRYGILGEGETPIVQFVRWLEGKVADPAEVSGLLFSRGGQWQQARESFGFVADANQIPCPDWPLLQPQNYYPYMESASIPLRGRHAVPVLTSRGCPYLCTFCSGGLTNQRRMRYRSPRNIVDEIKTLKRDFGADEIYFTDDNLTMDLKRAEEIFDLLIAERVNIHWRAPNGLRIDRLSEPLVEKMARSGAYYVGVGIETGNPDVMRRIKKRVDLAIVPGVVKLLHKYKIQVNGFFICGLRGETEAEMGDSLRFALSVPFDRIQVGNYIPYPGSEDFEVIFNASDPAAYRANVMEFQARETVPKFQDLSLGEIVKIQKKFLRRFYLRPRVLWSMLTRLRFSQLLALSRHPWIRRWFDKKVTWYDNV